MTCISPLQRQHLNSTQVATVVEVHKRLASLFCHEFVISMQLS